MQASIFQNIYISSLHLVFSLRRTYLVLSLYLGLSWCLCGCGSTLLCLSGGLWTISPFTNNSAAPIHSDGNINLSRRSTQQENGPHWQQMKLSSTCMYIYLFMYTCMGEGVYQVSGALIWKCERSKSEPYNRTWMVRTSGLKVV